MTTGLQKIFNFMTQHGVKIHHRPGGGAKLRGLSRLPADQAAEIVEQARQHRAEIIDALDNGPALCEVCPAAGTWPGSAYGDAGLLCFYDAYFEARPGRPVPCDQARRNCPLKNSSGSMGPSPG